MTVDWPGGVGIVASDEHIDTGPIGLVLPVGPTSFTAEPYSTPEIWVLAGYASPLTSYRVIEESFGPIELGMTLGEASAALGLMMARIDIGCGVVLGDPYSPLFGLAGTGEEATITSIIPTWDDSTTPRYGPWCD